MMLSKNYGSHSPSGSFGNYAKRAEDRGTAPVLAKATAGTAAIGRLQDAVLIIAGTIGTTVTAER